MKKKKFHKHRGKIETQRHREERERIFSYSVIFSLSSLCLCVLCLPSAVMKFSSALFYLGVPLVIKLFRLEI